MSPAARDRRAARMRKRNELTFRRIAGAITGWRRRRARNAWRRRIENATR